MLTREDLLPARMAEALVESGIDVGDTDALVRVLIEAGFAVAEIREHMVDAVDEALAVSLPIAQTKVAA